MNNPFTRLSIAILLLASLLYILEKDFRPNVSKLTMSSEDKHNSGKLLDTNSERTQLAPAETELRKSLSAGTGIPSERISRRDLSFYSEFPGFDIIRTKDYLILTEKQSYAFKNALKTLDGLNRQFREYFQPFIRTGKKHLMQAVFLDSEQSFNTLKKSKNVPEWIGGFYHIDEERLYLFNPMDISKSKSSLAYNDVPYKYKSLIVETMSGQFAEVLKAMRHEGAHQLLIYNNILDPASRIWLHEGFASIIETPRIGMAHRQYSALLTLLPYLRVKSIMQFDTFHGLSNEAIIQAYTYSWCLVYYLIQPSRKLHFFRYLARIRKEAANGKVRPGGDIDQLAKALGISSDQLERDFERFAKQMSAGRKGLRRPSSRNKR